MKISRAQSQYLALSVVVLFLGLGMLLLRSAPASIPVEQTKHVAEKQHKKKSSFVLNKFHRTETKDGKKIWEVTAQRGKYFPKTSTAVLQKATFIIYRKNGDVIEISSKEAELEFQENTLALAKLITDVKMNINKETFVTSDKAYYDKQEDSIFTPGYAKIKNDQMTVEGVELQVDVQAKTIEFLNDVETRIHAKEK